MSFVCLWQASRCSWCNCPSRPLLRCWQQAIVTLSLGWVDRCVYRSVHLLLACSWLGVCHLASLPNLAGTISWIVYHHFGPTYSFMYTLTINDHARFQLVVVLSWGDQHTILILDVGDVDMTLTHVGCTKQGRIYAIQIRHACNRQAWFTICVFVMSLWPRGIQMSSVSPSSTSSMRFKFSSTCSCIFVGLSNLVETVRKY